MGKHLIQQGPALRSVELNESRRLRGHEDGDALSAEPCLRVAGQAGSVVVDDHGGVRRQRRRAVTITSGDTPATQMPAESRHGKNAAAVSLSPWLAPVALLVAMVAVGLASWVLTSAPSAAPAANTLAGDPKARVCNAFQIVSKAVSGQTHADLGPDPVAQEAVAGNARLALLGGGQYLLGQLDAATPPQLADPVRSFADDLQDVGMNALAGTANTDADQSARMAHADVTRKRIVDLCK